MKLSVNILFRLFKFLAIGIFLLSASHLYSQEQVIDSLNQALKTAKAKEIPELYRQIGVTYSSMDKKDKAIEYYKKAIFEAENNEVYRPLVRAKVNIGVLLSENREYDSARILFEEAIEIGENNKLHEPLARALDELGLLELNLGQLERALELSLKQIKISQENNLPNLLANAYLHVGYYYYLKGEFFKTAENWKKELEVRETMEVVDSQLLAQTYNNLGVVYKIDGNYEKALEYLQKILEITETRVKTETDKNNLANVNANIAGVYVDMGYDLDKALKYYEKTLSLYLELGDSIKVSNTYQAISTVYQEMEDFDKAVENAKMCLAYSSAKETEALGKMTLGSIAIDRKRFYDAINYLDEAVVIFENLGDPLKIATCNYYLGSAYKEIGEYDKAIEYSNRALQFYKTNDVKRRTYDVYKNLSDIYKQTNDFKQAYEFFSKYSELKDSTRSEEYNKKVNNFERMEQEQKNKLLEVENEKKKADLKRSRFVVYAMSIGLIMFVVFLAFIIRLYVQIRKVNSKLEIQNEEIANQRDQILNQKQEITDSIEYASRIQRAILPPEENIAKYMPDHFILWRPRDIVSGDFYWIAEKDEYLVWIAADCTGHGVPGAFMSMLGTASLNEIVNNMGVIESNRILDELRRTIVKSLHQTGEIGTSQDGMDVALCVLNRKTNTLQFSGAYNPLFLIRDNELIEVKADKMPIGISEKTNPFSKEEVELKKGDSLYIFSDGYIDQFGGPNGKKFMKKRFKSLLLDIVEKPMHEQSEILNYELEDWIGVENSQIDDIIIIGVRV